MLIEVFEVLAIFYALYLCGRLLGGVAWFMATSVGKYLSVPLLFAAGFGLILALQH